MFCYKVYQAVLYIFSENQIPACPPSPDAAEKPKLSYAQLIAEALLAAPERMLTLAEIYASIAERHPYYRSGASKNWQNAIRHNLTLNKGFLKVPRPHSAGRGNYWRMEVGAEAVIFKRQRRLEAQSQRQRKLCQGEQSLLKQQSQNYLQPRTVQMVTPMGARGKTMVLQLPNKTKTISNQIVVPQGAFRHQSNGKVFFIDKCSCKA